MPLPHFSGPRWYEWTISDEKIRKYVNKQISYIYGEEYDGNYYYDGLYATNFYSSDPKYDDWKVDRIFIGKTQSEILFNLKVLIREKKLKRVLK